MKYEEIKQKIIDEIMNIREEQDLGISEVQDDDSLVENLGLASLDVATLVVTLEDELGVDPFMMNMAVITEIRTVEDMAKVYENCLNQKEG